METRALCFDSKYGARARWEVLNEVWARNLANRYSGRGANVRRWFVLNWNQSKAFFSSRKIYWNDKEFLFEWTYSFNCPTLSLFSSLRTYDTIFSKIHEFYHVCTALNLHVNVHAMWICKSLWWQEAAACVKYLRVCRGCLQLCRRPSIMHASTLLPQLWSQPCAEVGALYHAAAHFFKAGTRNRGARKKKPYNRMGRGDKAAFVSVCHIWVADFNLD